LALTIDKQFYIICTTVCYGVEHLSLTFAIGWASVCRILAVRAQLVPFAFSLQWSPIAIGAFFKEDFYFWNKLFKNLTKETRLMTNLQLQLN
jgi:hypothetical protein